MMPPKGPRLSARQLETLRAWIDQGASWAGPAGRRRRPRLVVAPAARPPCRARARAGDAAGVRNPIDAFVRAKLREKGLAAVAGSRPADPDRGGSPST